MIIYDAVLNYNKYAYAEQNADFAIAIRMICHFACASGAITMHIFVCIWLKALPYAFLFGCMPFCEPIEARPTLPHEKCRVYS